MSEPLVDLVVEEPEWVEAVPDLARVADDAAHIALAAAGVGTDGVAVALLACDDARIAALNAAFRASRASTNVLSWPAFALAPPRPGAHPPGPPEGTDGRRIPLGDVAIALQTCRAEAEIAQRPLKNHATHLILHGILHLLGYDHQTDADAELMEGIESRALSAAGMADPHVQQEVRERRALTDRDDGP